MILKTSARVVGKCEKMFNSNAIDFPILILSIGLRFHFNLYKGIKIEEISIN